MALSPGAKAGIAVGIFGALAGIGAAVAGAAGKKPKAAPMRGARAGLGGQGAPSVIGARLGAKPCGCGR